MTVKKKTASAESLRFSNIPAGPSYKPLSLQNPKALNSFYRSFLFSNVSSAEGTNVQDADVVARNIEKRTVAVEAAPKPEEQLYISDKITVSNIYPNPASEFAVIDYTMSGDLRDAKVIFYNVLGSKMSEHGLSKNVGKLRVDTTTMPTGLYFYQLSLDGKKVATKKMLVRHQQ